MICIIIEFSVPELPIPQTDMVWIAFRKVLWENPLIVLQLLQK